MERDDDRLSDKRVREPSESNMAECSDTKVAKTESNIPDEEEEEEEKVILIEDDDDDDDDDFEEQIEYDKSIIISEKADEDDEDIEDEDDEAWADEDSFDTWFGEPRRTPTEEEKTKEFVELMVREDCNLMPNIERITCAICLDQCEQADGVILRDCLHTFCRVCLTETVRHCEEPLVRCPHAEVSPCESFLQEREIKALVDPELYERYLAKSITHAENEAGNEAFHCQTSDCPGWAFLDANVRVFPCPVCQAINCVACRDQHEGITCVDFQERVKKSREASRLSEAELEAMVARGKIMRCPKCGVFITKTSGCDAMNCRMCKIALCWATKGARWGPGGRGDTSGGCGCKPLEGQMCHPQCRGCH